MRRVLVAACAALASGTVWADHPLGGHAIGTAGPITTVSAATLPQGASAASMQIEQIVFRPIGDQRLLDLAAQDIETHAIRSTLVPSASYAYGVTDDLTIGLRLPYVYRRDIREAHVEIPGDPPELHLLGNAKGVGDLTALGQWRFMNRTGMQMAALFGVKAPTGKTDAVNALGEQFETEHQAGSGSWDGLAGVAVSGRLGVLALDASALLTLAGEGSRDTRLGNRLNYNAALSYRLEEGEHAHGAGAAAHGHSAWDLVLELNGEWQDKVEVASASLPNTGGSVLYLSPGVRVSARGWSAFASLGVPVVRHLNGVQHEPDYRWLAGVAFGL